MAASKLRAQLWMKLALLYAMCLPAACGGTDEPGTTADGIDRAFDTPTALVDHFNELRSARHPDLRVLAELYHAENEFQRRLVRWDMQCATVTALDYAFLDQFNEHLDPEEPRLWQIEVMKDRAKIIEANGDRAVATYTDVDGKEWKLHLVRTMGWRISGYTAEYDFNELVPDVRERPHALADVEAWATPRVLAAETLLSRVKAGEFQTAADARREFQELLSKYGGD